jgi:hypothetical protein
MKRMLTLSALLLVAGSAFAFDPKPAAPTTPRVGVLRIAEDYDHGEAYVARLMVQDLRKELRERGIDAYDTGLTYDEVSRGDGEDADYFVEIAGAGANSGSYAGVGIGSWDFGVGVDLVVSHVAAEVRIYDGRNGELVKRQELRKRNTAVMPTSLYLGGSRWFAAIATPFVQARQYRTITRSAARDAAQLVVSAISQQ